MQSPKCFICYYDFFFKCFFFFQRRFSHAASKGEQTRSGLLFFLFFCFKEKASASLLTSPLEPTEVKRMFGYTAIIDLKLLHWKLFFFSTRLEKTIPQVVKWLSAIPPLLLPTDAHLLFYYKLSRTSEWSITLISSRNRNESMYSRRPSDQQHHQTLNTHPVVIYNRTGATWNTLPIQRDRNCNNSKIQQILKFILGNIYYS